VSELAVPARQLRLAAGLYGAGAVALLIWAGVFSAINGNLEVEIDGKSQLLESLQRRATSATVGTDKAGATAAQFAAISAPTETVAASTLQQYLLDGLEQAGGAVQSVQAEPGRETTAQGLHRVTAQIVFDGSTDTLQNLLFELETGTPYVFVDTLSAQPAAASDGAAANVSELLRVTLVVSSYWTSAKEVERK
jgi:general secretion pathway protein M